MRAKTKDPEYRRRENEWRKLQLREEKKKKREKRMVKIPPLSVPCKKSGNVENKSGELTTEYVVRKEVVYIKHTTLIHERVDSANKEKDGLIVYRDECGEIKWAWPCSSRR